MKDIATEKTEEVTKRRRGKFSIRGYLHLSRIAFGHMNQLLIYIFLPMEYIFFPGKYIFLSLIHLFLSRNYVFLCVKYLFFSKN